jgi:SAM-dependent methyltransferase
MHPEAFDYIRRMTAGRDCSGQAILEIGSYNVNGSVRRIFRQAARYVGVDIRPGPGVDVVWDGATFPPELAGPFDVVVSTETFEHADDPQLVLDLAEQILRPGGLLLLTAASPERAPHSCDGYDTIPPGEHYAGIDPDTLTAWLAGWDAVAIEHHAARGDVYARAVKRGESDGTQDARPAEVPERSGSGD